MVVLICALKGEANKPENRNARQDVSDGAYVVNRTLVEGKAKLLEQQSRMPDQSDLAKL